MRHKFFICTATLAMLLPMTTTAKRVPTKVQGIDYASTLPKDGRLKAASDFEWDPNPDAPALPATEFTFDDIENWTGEGANRAALIIQWNDKRETHAIVFGYRWDGQATGADMIKAVAKNNPRLYTLMQYTNVSSPTDPNGGYTICGIGWDADNNGDISLVDSKDGTIYTSEDGFFEHPRGYKPGQGGSSDYDYDDWLTMDEEDFWGAGWYSGFWSYWVGTMGETLSFSNWGASGRVLEDGCADGWNFEPGFQLYDWKNFKSAPSTIPDGAKTEFKIGDLFYQLTDYQKGAVKLVNPSVLTTIEGAAYRDFTGEAIVIPATFTDGDGEVQKTYTVTHIDDGAFAGVTGITSVTIPATVKKIGKKAFFECANLTEVKGAEKTDLNTTLTSIGEQAFESCTAFITPLYPTAMKTLPARIYYGCQLTEDFSVPTHIEEIGAEAFAESGIKTIKIAPTLKTINAKAFYSNGITSVKSESLYPATMAEDAFMDEVYANATLTIPTGFKNTYASATGWGRFTNVTEMNVAVTEGEKFSSENVTYVLTDMTEETPAVEVSFCKVEGKADRTTIAAANKAGYTGDLVIPSRITFMGREYPVTAINDSAFYGAESLTSIRIEAPVSKIGQYTFYNCKGLTKVELPTTVKEIGRSAFSYTGLTSITLPEGVETIAETAFFSSDAMQSVNIPVSVKTLGDRCFGYCKSLTSVDLSNITATMGSKIFLDCTKLAEVKLPASMTAIPSAMFSGCNSLTTMEIPETVTEIGSSAFENCKSYVVTIPAGVTTIGDTAFSGCANETFSVPAAITTIPKSIFSNCANLRDVTVSNNVTAIGYRAFYNSPKFTTLNIHKGNEPDVQPTAAPEENTTGLHFPSALTKIDQYAFYGTAITEVSIPTSVTTLGANAFQGCKSLTSAYIPGTIATPGDNLFQDCSALRKVTLAEGLTKIGGNMFRNTGIEEIIVEGMERDENTPKFSLPSTVKSLGNWAFGGCKNITAISIPEGVTSIPMSCFNGCSNLSEISLPSTLTMFGSNAFAGCSLKQLVAPAKVNSFGNSMVQNNADVVIYICSTAAPKKIYSSPFGTTSGKYAPLVVCSGLKATYEGQNYWNKSVISEPNVESMDFSIRTGNLTDTEAEILVCGTVAYGEELPEAFRMANDNVLFTGDASAFRLSHSIVSVETPIEAQAENTEEPVVEDLTLNADGTCAYRLTRPEFTTTYAVKVTGEHAAGTVETPEQNIKIAGTNVQTGITGLIDLNDSDIEVYTLSGLRVRKSDGLASGTYIVRRGSQTAKITVK